MAVSMAMTTGRSEWTWAVAVTGIWLVVLALSPVSASADLSRFVAIGGSMSAGLSRGSLHVDGQAGGYARLIAAQARGAGVPFEQPLMTEPGVPAVAELKDSPWRVEPKAGLGSPVNLTLARPYDNLSVPGAKVHDVVRTRTDNGGFHDLVLRGLGTQLEQALLLEPTFVSLWVGVEDAFGAIVSGIVLDGVTLTPTADFAADYNLVVQTLVANGITSGVVGTVPGATSIPFVTTLEPIAVDRLRGEPLLVEGAEIPLLGPDGPLSKEDRVLLTASPLLARGDGIPASLGGSGRPLPDRVVLSRVELDQIEARIAEYNSVIRRAAADVGFAVFDAAELFGEMATSGIRAGGSKWSSAFPDGGLVSLDGVHPSALGYAGAANASIEAINRTYGTTIALIDLEPLALARRALLPGAGPSDQVPSASRIVYLPSAYRNLRFALGVDRPRRLMRLRNRALEELRRERRPLLYQPPPEPRLAATLPPALGPVAGAPAP